MATPIQDISVSICGHACHGKSTLLGKLVAERGLVQKREVEAAQERANASRDASFVFAQLVFRSKRTDHAQSEGKRGVTILPSMVRFEYPDHRITVVDTPGQANYANNRFFGMFQADCALLVVAADEGPMPITHQVLRILKGFQIPLRGVVISKMDTVDYAESVFLERKAEVEALLSEYELPPETTFIPTSAYETGRDIHAMGEGITGFERITWFKGPALNAFLSEQTYDSLRDPEGPLRLVIHGSEVYDNVPGFGKAATALVESGTVKPDITIQFEPLSTERKSPVTGRVRSLQLTKGHVPMPETKLDEGSPRQLVGVAFGSFSEKDTLRELFRGRGVVAGLASDPPRVAQRMQLELTVFDANTFLRPGGILTMHVHVDRCAIKVEKVLAKRDEAQSNHWVETEEDDLLGPSEWGRIEVSCANRPVAIEESDVLPALSRFVLREGSKAVAYGRCIRILE